MANRQRGEVELEIEGKAYRLVFDLNAQCELEELLSTPQEPFTLQAMLRWVLAMRPTWVRGFFWACLRKYHREITVEGVSDLMVDAGGMARFVDKLAALLETVRPDPEDAAALVDKKGRPTVAAGSDGTGESSTSKRARSGSRAMSSGR